MNDLKKNDQLTDQGHTGLMGIQFVLNITQGVLDAIEEAQVTRTKILEWDQKELRLLSKKATQKFLGLVTRKRDDPWIEEKLKIEKFYKEYFNRVIDWSMVFFPAKSGIFKKIEYIFVDITEDQILKAYARKFGKDKMYLWWKSVTNAIKKQQARPVGNRVFAHVGDIEIDMPNKSYNMGISEGIKFMIPKEGFIAAFRERTETGKMYDVIGLTRFAALDQDGRAMRMYRDRDGRFCVDGYFRDAQYPNFGLRQIEFVSNPSYPKLRNTPINLPLPTTNNQSCNYGLSFYTNNKL